MHEGDRVDAATRYRNRAGARSWRTVGDCNCRRGKSETCLDDSDRRNHASANRCCGSRCIRRSDAWRRDQHGWSRCVIGAGHGDIDRCNAAGLGVYGCCCVCTLTATTRERDNRVHQSLRAIRIVRVRPVVMRDLALVSGGQSRRRCSCRAVGEMRG